MRKFLLPILLAALFLTGCGSKDVIKPAKLESFSKEVSLKKAWRTDIGGSSKGRNLRLIAEVSDGAIFAVSADGVVRKLDRESGKTLWKKKTGEEISGGVAAGGEQLVISNTNGEVIALDAGSGEEQWRSAVSSEVLSPATMNYKYLFVQSSDDKLYALDRETGDQAWVYEAITTVLSLRGNSRPQLIENWVVAGFSNGKLVAIDVDTGAEVWNRRVGSPSGRSELERIVDIDGNFLFDGQRLFAASYQGAIVALDLATSRQLWEKEVSTYTDLASSFGVVYVADASGTVIALDENTGAVRWEQDVFSARDLSSPIVFGNYLLFGDYDGYVHALSIEDGRQVGRRRLDNGPITNTITADQDQVYVLDQDGTLTALKLKPRE